MNSNGGSSSTPRRQHVKFSEDWDKLAQPRFTTIRSYRLDKERFYRKHLGETFTVLRVNNYWSHIGRKIGEATLLGVRVQSPKAIPVDELVRDVSRGGRIDEEWMRRILAMDVALVLEFENHTGLLA